MCSAVELDARLPTRSVNARSPQPRDATDELAEADAAVLLHPSSARIQVLLQYVALSL